MNERIKELIGQMDQSGIPHQAGDNSMTVTDRDLEYFAELIIRECAELTLDYKNTDYYNGWLDHHTEIKRHFGVKE
jgi:hypothetical protein